MASSTEPVRVLAVAVDGERLETADADVEVLDVASSTEARDALAENPVDCVVSRYALPDGTGVELLQQIREDHPDLPFVLAPVEGSEAIASAAISAGVTEYLHADPDGDESTELASLVRAVIDDGRGAADAGWDLDADVDPTLDLPSRTNLLEQIFTQVPVSLYVKDTEGRHLLMSDYDTSPVEATGKTDLELYEPALASESFEDDMHVIETGEAIRNKEEYSPDTDGWVLTSKVPWYGEDGDVRGLIGVTRFITEKKEYEREIERKNDRLERFARVISHDLRNPLTVAQGRLEFVGEDVDDEHVDIALDALTRMETLIDDVLELARQGQTIDETELVSLSWVVEHAWSTVDTAEATLAFETDCQFQADGSRLVQLLENLLRNAVEHGSTSPRSQAPEDAVEHGSTSPRSQAPEDAVEHGSTDATLRISAIDDADGFYVEDDGPGIPAGERETVFEPGHTSAEDGTGFGLAIVAEIVEAHGWEITATESATGGARFEVTGVDCSE